MWATQNAAEPHWLCLRKLMDMDCASNDRRIGSCVPNELVRLRALIPLLVDSAQKRMNDWTGRWRARYNRDQSAG